MTTRERVLAALEGAPNYQEAVERLDLELKTAFTRVDGLARKVEEVLCQFA